MKRGHLQWVYALGCLLLALPEAAPSAGLPPPSAAPDRDAPYKFVIGKVLLLEGSAREAAAAFEQALQAAPNDPYVHLEYAAMLLRQAQFSPANRGALLARVIEHARQAAAGAPNDVDVLRLLGQAEMALAESDPKALPDARRAFEALIAARPEDLPGLSALGQIYLEQGEAAKAADVLTAASRLRPDSSTLSAMLLEALLKAERNDEAATMLRHRLDEDASDLPSRLALADLLSDSGDHAGAAVLLRVAPGEQRVSTDVRRRLAIECYRSGDLEGALNDIEPLLAADPGYTGGRYLRGLVFAALARTTEAEADFAALLQARPENADFALNLARVLERQGRRAEAYGFLEETLKRLDAAAAKAAPAEAKNAADEADRLRVALALAAVRGKDWARVDDTLQPLFTGGRSSSWAEEALFIAADERVEAGRGDDALALLSGREEPAFAGKRCEVLQRLGHAADAKSCFDRLVALPGEAGLVEAADARQRLDDFAGSIPLLETARARKPEAVDVQYRLASAYERTGQRAPAMSLLRGILVREPDNAAALNYLGYMLAENGESLDEALSLARRAVAIDPGNGAYVDSLGWAHFRLGQYDRASLYLERAAGLMPDDPTVCEHLGDTYAAAGDSAKARATYRRALGLGGDNAAQIERKLRGLPGGS